MQRRGDAFADPSAILSVGAARVETPRLLEQQRGDEGEHQGDAQQIEGIAEGHDIGLLAHPKGHRDDRLEMRRRDIGYTAVEEVRGQPVDPIAGRFLEQRDRACQDVGMELLALGLEGLQHGNADRAAEIARHVEQCRCGPGIGRFDPGGGDRRQRREYKCLAECADDVRPEQLVGCRVQRHVNVHEITRREQHKADSNHDSGVEPLHQARHQRYEQQLWKPGPREHEPDLLGVVALNAREIERKDEYRAVKCDAEQEVRQHAEAEVAAHEKTEVEQRAVGHELDDDKERQGNGGYDRQPNDERRAEPVVLVALFQHGLQRGEPDRHGEDAQPVALSQQLELHRRPFEREPQHGQHRHAWEQVDVEDVFPAPVLGQVAADGRADGGCERGG